LLFALSDPVLLSIVGVVNVLAVGLVGAVMFVLKEYYDRQRDKQTAAKVLDVKKDLQVVNENQDHKLEDLATVAIATQKQGEAIHTLVNSNMGVQLRIASVALDRVAELTNHPEDIAAASLAKKQLQEHEAKQATVDKQG
jgi:hypothetical protein